MTPPAAKQNIVLAASEVTGFAKTGGLADVLGALPPALARRGHQCSVFLPLYHSVRASGIPLTPTPHKLAIPLGNRTVQAYVWKALLPNSDVAAYLIDQPEFYDRDRPGEGRGLYQFTLPGGEKRDYPDNCERFVFFSRAVLQAIEALELRPTIVHANDWQTGLIPVFLREEMRKKPEFRYTRSLFTIHNIAYQGTFWHWDMLLTGLDWKYFDQKGLEFYGQLNFLKAGVVFADLISTVSPTYAREIQTAAYGCGLEGVVTERREHLLGIVNGVDYRVWNPATDRQISANYSLETISSGKPMCKEALQKRLGLEVRPRTPLLGVVARLVSQKGVDLICAAGDALINLGAQLVVLGEGDSQYHKLLQELQRRHPNRVSIYIGFNEALAHQIEAGSDIFLMPSLFEPSGLNQLYSLKYGTVPVVRATGGLADSITDCNTSTSNAGPATGFSFVPYSADALRRTVERAINLYQDMPASWERLMQNCMRQDWSWDHVAIEYERIYSRVAKT
ncbi:glycogen synthase GlgA [soil metagenome]